MKTRMAAGQPSWHFASDKVEAAITELGGHLAPVRFRLKSRTIEPFSIAPWAEEKLSDDVPPVLQALRGDFFCAPFGGNQTSYRGELHPPHGETANSKWHFESLLEDPDRTTLHLSLATHIRAGRVDKFIELRKGHSAIYCKHVLSGMSGKLNAGHHAMLKFPDEANAGFISTSRIRYGQVLPTVFEDPARRGYTSLKPGARFSRLDRVPSLQTGTADVSRYPTRRGFEDLFMVIHQDRSNFAWTAVTFPKDRYVWFALKDPRVLQSTIFWISNGGRHYPPWNGRHVNVMGLEDVTAYFHYGLSESAKVNDVNRKGFSTSLTLHRNTPFNVNYIMGVAAIPGNFERVATIESNPDSITLVSSNNHRMNVPIDTAFLYRNSP